MMNPTPEQAARIEAHARAMLSRLTADRGGVADVATILEALLALRFGAAGNGLGTRLRAVEAQLPEPLARDLRYIAAVRNDVLHNPLSSAHDPERFIQAARRCIQALLLPAKETARSATARIDDVDARPIRAGMPAADLRRRQIASRGLWPWALTAALAAGGVMSVWLLVFPQSREAPGEEEIVAEAGAEAEAVVAPVLSPAPPAPKAAAERRAAPKEREARPAQPAAAPRRETAEPPAAEPPALVEPEARPARPAADTADDPPLSLEQLRALRGRL